MAGGGPIGNFSIGPCAFSNSASLYGSFSPWSSIRPEMHLSTRGDLCGTIQSLLCSSNSVGELRRGDTSESNPFIIILELKKGEGGIRTPLTAPADHVHAIRIWLAPTGLLQLP